MSSPLFPHIYEELLNSDIEWLRENSPDCLERKNIIDVLKFSIKEYRIRGYMESMRHDGPHYEKTKTQR